MIRKPRGPQFKLNGNSLMHKTDYEGRPIPSVFAAEDPLKRDEAFNKYNEAKKSVHIPTIFKGSTVQNYVKDYSLEERRRREEQRTAAVKIQKNYRQHLKDKRFIENRKPLTPEAIEWAKNYRMEMIKRRLEKEKSLLEEKIM